MSRFISILNTPVCKLIFLLIIIFTQMLLFGKLTSASSLDPKLLEFIESQILKFKPDSFIEDQIALQEVDPSGELTTYIHQSSQVPLFISKGSTDKGKPVVVLGQDEDRLLKCNNKNTFLVLRQTEDQKGNAYWILLAYVSETPSDRTIEWDIWDDRGLAVNRGLLFGWTTCQSSSIIPCKPEIQTTENPLTPYPVTSLQNDSLTITTTIFDSLDYFCDILSTTNPKSTQFIASTVDTMINSMVILSNTQLLYQNEDKVVEEIAKDIKSIVPNSKVSQMGRSFFGNSKDPLALELASELGAKKLLEKGREGIAKAVLMFDTSVSRIGALNIGESLDSILSSTRSPSAGAEADVAAMSRMGKILLRGLFEGASTEDKYEKFINPNPKALLKDEVVQDLVYLRKISEDRFKGRLFGFVEAPTKIESPPKETGKSVIITLCTGEKAEVISVEGGIYFKDYFVEGKLEKSTDKPEDLNFIPEDKLVLLTIPTEFIPLLPSKVEATEEQLKSGVRISINTQGNYKINVVAVDGGILLNRWFFKGSLQHESTKDLRFVPSQSKEVQSGRFFGNALLPNKKLGTPMTIYLNGVEQKILSIQGGIVFNEKFLPGEIRTGCDKKIVFIPQPAGGSAPVPRTTKICTSEVTTTSGSSSAKPQPSLTVSLTLNPSTKVHIAFTFYMDNSTSSTPYICYVTPRGFLFYGVFFPGRVIENFLPDKPDIYYIELQGQVYLATPIEKEIIKTGLTFPPMPPMYEIIINNKPVVAYFIEIGFILSIEDKFSLGKELPGTGSVELAGVQHKATCIPQNQAPVVPMPGMAGAYLIIIQGKQYLAYIVFQGVLIGGVFLPCKFQENGIIIQETLYKGTYMGFLVLKTHILYTVTNYIENHNILVILGKIISEVVEFSTFYLPVNAILDISKTFTTLHTCPMGHTLIAPLGLPGSMATQILTRDFESDLLNELNRKPYMKTGSKTGSKALDNTLNILTNAADWYGDKTAGQIFQENLIGGIWTPLGFIDDVADTIGWVTGAGKVSDDYGYIDDLFGVVLSGVNSAAGIAGKIIDGVGSLLNPIGLGGVWKSVAGSVTGTIGVAVGIQIGEFFRSYDLIKVGAKTVHLGWLLGLRGSESEKKHLEMENKVKQLQGIKTYLIAHPPTCEVTGSVSMTTQIQIQAQMHSELTGHTTTPPPTGRLSFFGRKKRSFVLDEKNPILITDVDLFSHIGWKTIQIKQDSLNISFEEQKEPFIGIGACEYEKPTLKELEAASSPKDLVNFYMRALKTQCLKGQKDGLMDLIKFKYLQMTPDKTFSIDSKQLKSIKLTPQEKEMLSKSFEISVFSKTYQTLLKSESKSYSNTVFLRKFVANYLSQAVQEESHHSIKLIRSLLKTLHTIFIKSLQDFYRYKYCPKCPEDLIRTVMEVPTEILGLIQFVSSTNPIMISSPGDQLEKDYVNWLGSKKNEIDNLLRAYLV